MKPSTDEASAIRPWPENPAYWQYRGEPVLLIGASDDDNLFQWTGSQLTDHLDRMISVGGNYVRNTMSDRDPGNVFAFSEVRDGVYDLDQWNDAYWRRLSFFLDATADRGIIVQLTLWDYFDIVRQWDRHPWNPQNNVSMESGAWEDWRGFYDTVAGNDQAGLHYQHRYIDKLLSITLRYGHLLYNINNESSHGPQWENYWAQYVNAAAEKAGRQIYVTSMQLDPSCSVRHVMTHRHLYSYAEVSQSNQDSRGARGQGHWENLVGWRSKIASHPAGVMPMNNEKVYGSPGPNYGFGTETEAMNRFWRNIFAGCASSRFHRPGDSGPVGTGLNERAQTNLKAMRMLLEHLDIFACSPHNDLLHHHIAAPSNTEAYVTANLGRQYAIYFPPGRFTVELDPWVYVDSLRLRWLDIEELAWSDPETIAVSWEGGIREMGGHLGRVKLTCPNHRPHVALLDVPAPE